MACDPNTLINGARCFECYGMGRMFDAMEVVLLCAIVDGNTSMACDPQTLMSQANCLLCTIPDGMWEPIKVSLLCQIAAAGGGGGGGGTGGVICFTGADPVAAPANACTIAYRNDDGSLWKWNGASWNQLLGP